MLIQLNDIDANINLNYYSDTLKSKASSNYLTLIISDLP